MCLNHITSIVNEAFANAEASGHIGS